MNVKNNKEPN